MRVALISSRYRPETSPGAKRAAGLVASLQAAGHRVTVLTQLPNYPDPGSFGLEAPHGERVTIEEDDSGDAIWRCVPRVVSKENLLGRLLSEARFARLVSRSRTGLVDLDGVVASSPFVFNLRAARTYRAPMWLDLRDLTWEYARRLGGGSPLRALGAAALRSVALSCFRAARGVSTTTSGQRDYLIARGVRAERVHVVPNGVPRDVIDELRRRSDSAGDAAGGPLRVVYAGLLGYPQGLDFVVRRVEELGHGAVELHLYGDGVERSKLSGYCRAHGIGHVHFHGYVSYDDYLTAITRADVLLASLRPEVRTALPSKILEYMAAAKPIVFVGGGEGAMTVEEASAGVSIDYGDGRRFGEALRELSRDPALRAQLGASGRDWVRRHRVREEINRGWVEALEGSFGRSSSRSATPLTRGRASWIVTPLRRAAPWAARCAEATGILHALESLGGGRGGRLAVLTYHRVVEPDASESCCPGLLSATPAGFACQMEFLAASYRVVSIEDVLESFRGGRPLPAGAVLVTFDDAYADFADHAWPILARLGLVVTLFVPTGFPDRPERIFWWDRLYRSILATRVNGVTVDDRLVRLGDRVAAYRRLRDHVKSLPHGEAMTLVDRICDELDDSRDDPPDGAPPAVLGWDALRKLASDGVTLGAHTRSHPFLDRVPDDEARAEVAASLEDLEREIGAALPVFAYPGGRLDPRSVRAVSDAGVELAFTTRGGVNVVSRCDPLELRRIHVGARTTRPILRARLMGVRG